MAPSSQDRDYFRHCREMRSGHIAKPNNSAFIAHETTWKREAMAEGARAVKVSSGSLVWKELCAWVEKKTRSSAC